MSDRGPGCVGVHDEAPEQEYGLLCWPCYRWLVRTLRDLPTMATWLRENIAAGGSGQQEKVGGTREDPIPLRLDVLDLIGPDSRHWPRNATSGLFYLWEDGRVIGYYDSWREAKTARDEEMRLAGVEETVIQLLARRSSLKQMRLSDVPTEKLEAARQRWQIRPLIRGGSDQAGEDAIRSVLFSWVTTVTEESPDFGWPDNCDEIPVLAKWLAGHLLWISEQQWVDEFSDELHRLTSVIHKTTPWRAEVKHDPTPCTVCNVRAIVIHLAEGRSVCEKNAGGCGRVMTWDRQSEAS